MATLETALVRNIEAWPCCLWHINREKPVIISDMNSINVDELKQFLMRANMPHALGEAKTAKESDGSRTIEYGDGDYYMHDNFFGGEPYGGRLVVFYKAQPLFLEAYYGQTTRPADPVYDFLREALQHPDNDNPFRGPAQYKKDNLTYKSITEGNVANHTVKEYIYDGDEEIYWAVFIGGLVDQNARDAM